MVFNLGGRETKTIGFDANEFIFGVGEWLITIMFSLEFPPVIEIVT